MVTVPGNTLAFGLADEIFRARFEFPATSIGAEEIAGACVRRAMSRVLRDGHAADRIDGGVRRRMSM
jgi:hypothetical protein